MQFNARLYGYEKEIMVNYINDDKKDNFCFCHRTELTTH